jgi:hypothetical protein
MNPERCSRTIVAARVECGVIFTGIRFGVRIARICIKTVTLGGSSHPSQRWQLLRNNGRRQDLHQLWGRMWDDPRD